MSWLVLESAGVAMADPWTEFLANFNLVDAGATGLLALVIVMILMGKLVPKSVADAWRDAYRTEQASNRELMKQNTQLVASTTVTARVLDALPKASGGDGDGSA